ncbi:MAG: hypothetical protein V5B60_15300 [Accumulibacter sp.]|jgi:hypothetical protein|uniref:hypothetical protein n=1 Tax=Accumulibacter sp. TaxID=2053492 RepID=UPI002FC2C4AD
MRTEKIYIDSPPEFMSQPSAATWLPVERHLVSFHSGPPFSLAADRLGRQARATGWFDSVTILHPTADHPAMHAFASQLAEFAGRHPRGYGYWRWKPLLVQAVLSSLPEGAHLYYLDAGCELSSIGGERFMALDRELGARGVLCFEIDFPEHGWCKREAAEAILGRWHESVMSSRQIQATWFGLRNSAAVREHIAEWASWAIEGELITDAHAPERQHPLFCGHRHDQALWSLTLKKRGVVPMPQEDCFERWLYVPDSWVLLAPVHGLRSRGSRSRIDVIGADSSRECCLANLASPSLKFRSRLAASRLRARAVGWLSRIRSRIHAAWR